MTRRVFLLSPARCEGKRAGLLLNDAARFDLACRLREPSGVPLGEVFSFLSGLYFRGKLTYARAFAKPPRGVARALVITSNRGLVSAEERVTAADLRAFAQVSIDAGEPRYVAPLVEHATALAKRLARGGSVVLLGSVATDKYCEPLLGVLVQQLHFPTAFAGRGDMSRGGLMLRCAAEGRELTYTPLGGAARRGTRPPKLPPRAARLPGKAGG